MQVGEAVDPTMLPVFFSLGFCCLPGTVLSQAQPIQQLDCKANWEQGGMVGAVNCFSSKDEGELVVSADFLRQLNVTDELTEKIYLLSEYPYRVTGFSLNKRGGTRIMENALKALPNLTSLQLETFSGNITIPREEFKNTPDLTWLSVRHGTIPASTVQAIRSASKLEHLEIFNTTEGELKPDSLRGLAKLHTVKLAYNGFRTIEEGTFRGLTKLARIVLDGNNISTTEEGTFNGLTELVTLTLNGNKISSITNSLPKDSDLLKILEFRNNNISIIPKGAFAKYKVLMRLTLSENPITKIEAGAFQGLEKLSYLYLHSCPVNQLPESDLQKMKNLETLSLHGSMISKINSTTFKGLRKLEELDLGDCKQLTTIEPGSFDYLTSLTSLHLNGNPSLKNLPDGLLQNMKMLRYADFRGTCVENLSPANFTDYPRLSMLYFGDCAASGQ